MDYRLVFFICLCLVLYVSASSLVSDPRVKRDVMESMKNAGDTVAKTFSDAGDAVVGVFKPTEKSVVDKMADGVKSLTE
ncbi:unnamed protein product [Euphydryas editha]|uniref:Uncharacterized protein n=1 Tax=Euphydryas editha TaxID=104508 RepID=A0AAU9TRQ9_EUPED|nr:unnamed protein product [Euphydryas editha]